MSHTIISTQPQPRRTAPGWCAHVVRLILELSGYVRQHIATAFQPVSEVRGFGRALIAAHALLLCLHFRNQPGTDPAGVPSFGPGPYPIQPNPGLGPYLKPRAPSSRPHAPRSVASVHRNAMRRMEAKLAVYTVTEMLVTICRDLGILPDFDEWARIAATAFKRPRPPTPNTPQTPILHVFALWRPVPCHPSG